jgi:hypothetical protein
MGKSRVEYKNQVFATHEYWRCRISQRARIGGTKRSLDYNEKSSNILTRIHALAKTK